MEEALVVICIIMHAGDDLEDDYVPDSNLVLASDEDQDENEEFHGLTDLAGVVEEDNLNPTSKKRKRKEKEKDKKAKACRIKG